jgi:FMN phosphatase YigB (HAD superfamily)
MEPMKKVISFDLDGTLVDARYGDMVWNHGIPTEYSKKYGISFDEARIFVRSQYATVGDADLLWYEIDYWLERFMLPLAPTDLLNRYETEIEPLPYALEVLEALSAKYTLIIASNAARIFVEKELQHTGLGSYFEYSLSATTDYKMVKKEGSFYKRLCDNLRVSPMEIVHVGDHPIFDYDAPSSIGIESYFLLQEGPSTIAAISEGNGRRTIGNLKELLEWL